MQLSALLLASAASLVAAQSATTTAPAPGTPSCSAQLVLDTCIGTEQARVNSCATNDYSCLCNTYGDLLICYNNCPEDPGRNGVVQYQTQYCSAATAYGTTTSYGVANATSSASARTTASTTTTTTTSGGATGSATGTSSNTASTASSTHSGAAGLAEVNLAGILLAVVAGVYGRLL